MPRFLIERHIPGASGMSREDLMAASAKSCGVVDRIAGLSWIHSYVAGDRIMCIYDAPSEAAIREHSQQSGFPANSITEVKHIINPTWAN